MLPLRQTLPYRQSYEYDAFNNLTKRDNLNWGYSQVNGLRNFNLSYAYQNNRVVGIFNWQYDADGRNIYSSNPDEGTDSTYDAAGRLVMINQREAHVVTNRYFDGAGAEIKSTARDTAQTSGEIRVKYYLRSSVLGGKIISEANETGRNLKTLVHAAGAVLARQNVSYDASGNPTIDAVEFEQWDASGMSYRRTYGNTTNMYDGVSASGETDPMGGGVGLNGLAYAEANIPPERDFPIGQSRGEGETAVYQNGQWIPCSENGFQTSCARAQRNLESGITLRIISASAFLRVTRGNNTLFNGAIILNNGFGVGMTDASTFDQTSMINLSNLRLNGNDVARAQATGNWAGLIVGTRQTEATTRVTSWGGDSSRAWVNVAVDFNSQPGQAGGGGGSVNSSVEAEKKSDCRKTVDDLVWRTDGYKTNFGQRNVGRTMAIEAKNSLSRGSKDLPHDGFRWELVNNNQRGDVIKHIYGHAGTTVVGNAKIYGIFGGQTGYEISKREMNVDISELKDPAHMLEAETEIRNDIAGRKVGELMNQRMASKITRDDLSKQLFDILCEY